MRFDVNFHEPRAEDPHWVRCRSQAHAGHHLRTARYTHYSVTRKV